MIPRKPFRLAMPSHLAAFLLLCGVPYVLAAGEPTASLRLDQAALEALRRSPRPELQVRLPTGRSVAVRLVPFGLLAPGAQVTSTGASGTRAYRPHLTFLKGEVQGIGGSWSALTVGPRGVTGWIQAGDRAYRIDPDRAAPDGSVLHYVRESTSDQPAPLGARCGSDDLPISGSIGFMRSESSLAPGQREGLRLTCDLAIDCDYEYFAGRFGSDLERATDYLLSTLATLSVLYEREVNVSIRLTYVNVWITSDDPYADPDRSQRLQEFRNFWNANRADVPRTFAHLITGLQVGGVAYVGVLCHPSFGYGLTSLGGVGRYPEIPSNSDLLLLAHEVGHNFGSPHTQSCFWQDMGFTPAGTLLDSCVTAEGTCYSGPVGIVPPEGGTIMSYCLKQRLAYHDACRSWIRTQTELSCMPADSVQPPRNVTTVVEPTAVQLSWEPGGSDGVIRYDVYKSIYLVDPGPTLIGSSTTTSFTDGRILVPTYYKVRAVRFGDQSGFSREAAAAPLPDGPPSVESPAIVEGIEGSPVLVAVTVSDPEGDSILGLTAVPLPPGAAFDADASGTRGVLEWTPLCYQAGEYAITFTALSALGGATGSATTRLIILPTDCPPIVSAPDLIAAPEGSILELDVTAVDREGDPIQTLTATPLPEGATFTTTEDLAAGVFRWAPGYDQAGTYLVTFAAGNGQVGTDTTRIEISNVDRPPFVAAPPVVATVPGLRVEIGVQVHDPDGDPIASLQATGIPAGAVYSVAEANTHAMLEWLPKPGDEGSHFVTFTAANERSASATTRIDVNASSDHPPVVDAPPHVTGTEGVPLTVFASATDPDGDEIVSLQSGPLPRGAAFETDPAHTSGTLSWIPDFDQAGLYDVEISAVSASRAAPVSGVALTGVAVVILSIQDLDRAPRVWAPVEVNGAEGNPLNVVITAVDPDGDPISALVADVSSLPIENDARFLTADGNTTGTLSWTPTFADAGDYGVRFTAMNNLSDSVRTTIHVTSTNRAPSAAAGGPYLGFAGSPLDLDGSGSSDPDADDLGYRWSFGDGSEGVGIHVAHTYFLAGDYVVTLVVSDGSLTDEDVTAAGIRSSVEANAFVTGADRTIRLRSAKPTWCARVEPLPGSFDPSAIEPTTVRLAFGGSQIPALSGRRVPVEDSDRDDLPEFPACFAKSDLREIFSSLSAGHHTVPVLIEGALFDGGRFHAAFPVQVVSEGVSLWASVAPNPLNPDAMLTFVMPRVGRANVSLFDLRGRLVRTLLDEPVLPAGYHSLRLDGTDASGRTLSSGIYFYRIATSLGNITGRLAITR